ncbi:acetyl-CoA synthetase [Gracilibacillus halotolerans]|uniref:acetate--CoA ligase n=1 Tax=Gracilibacillus halotolerans TaxID=74386 RepID=A0A841RPE8_9BACI|nr:acetate--CoA ligase [Gracilibacillus halotolerans]MBB6513742.1 acetyl-CoA synthetase [Gracilibacillus halotolerans]
MTSLIDNILPALPGKHHLENYEELYSSFQWEEATKLLSGKKAGKINAAYEAIDRHVDEGYGDKIAIHYISDEETESYTYKDLQEKVNHYARVLKQHYNVQKGDRVFIFLPKSVECYVAIFAAIKVGAIAVPLFEAFMEDAIKDRVEDCQGSLLISDETLSKRVPTSELPCLETILLVEDIEKIQFSPSDIKASVTEWMDEEDGFLIHYTSGSTGKPKGVLHANRAIKHHAITGKYVLDIHDEDVYWCTSHPGWVTGSVYGLFAPLLNRATVVIHGGRFLAEDWYKIIETFQVTIWYSAPTAFRMLVSKGDLHKEYNLSSLRHILSVGEPLNPEVIHWAWENWRVRIHDTWWMTETGGHLIVNFPSAPIKPGSMGRPFPGIQVGILDTNGNELPRGELGQLAIKAPWPGIMQEIWGNKEKYDSYFPYDGWYVSGDLAYQDEEGYVFFQGRDDDMIQSAGEQIGPFEVESKLIEHPAVREAGVIGKPDAIRGEIVKAFITLQEGYEESEQLLEEIRLFVRNELAAHSAPRELEVMAELPKTKISGKILRRELKRLEIQRQENTE